MSIDHPQDLFRSWHKRKQGKIHLQTIRYSHRPGPGLGSCWLSLWIGRHTGVGRGAPTGPLGRMDRAKGQSAKQDRADARPALLDGTRERLANFGGTCL